MGTVTRAPSRSRHGATLAALTGLFALRVAGQAIQRWIPQPFLPPMEAFQGSKLPYSTLLTIQILILGLMLRTSWRVWTARSAPARGLGRCLAWFGGIYLAGSIARIGVGLLVPAAPPWFSTWIPAFFHLVLASWVLVLAAHHLSLPPPRNDA